jgi:hypothetical protein
METHLAVIDTNHTSDHFWDDDHIAHVGLHYCRFLVGWGLLFGFTQLLDESHGFVFDASLKSAAYTSVYQLFRMLG